MTGNLEKYPTIVQPPKKVIVDGEDYTVYKFIFRGLSDLYNYLKSNPKLNSKAFCNGFASINGDYSFAGEPYEKAVEQLVNYIDPKYKEFLKLIAQSQVKNIKRGASFKPTNTVSGGIIRPHALAIGDPHIYRTTKIIKNDSVVNIYVIANYLADTSESQVRNKAIILTNIIHALESHGYKVKVNAFSASKNYDEIIDVVLNIKGNNTEVNYQALYRALCNVEFCRRIIFRIRETSDVKNDWSGYGKTISEDFARKYLNIGKDDLYFGTPREMDVYGLDISEDFENAVYNLNLQNKIDVERAKVLIKKSIK